jgi:ribonuclease D
MPYFTDANDISFIISEYAQAKVLWLDTEIADYKTDSPRLSLIQILDDSTATTCDREALLQSADRVAILDVLDKPAIVPEFIEKIMSNPAIEKVFHNANYDLSFLGKSKAKNVTCTLEMAKKIPYYLVPLPNFQLKTLAEQLCHLPPVDKTEQGGDWGRRPLTANQLYYAKMDPVYVAQVHHRLLQLAEPDPATEDIEALTLRYRQIEHRWKQLDTEMNQIKERLKAAMDAQKVKDIKGFRLTSQERTTKKVAFAPLAKMTQALGIDLDLSVTLTKTLQKELGEAIEQLPVEEETTTVLQLKVTEPEADEELPF